MVQRLLKKFENNIQNVAFCYIEKIGGESYDTSVSSLKKYYKEFVDMVHQMYMYDIINTEEWRYLNDRGYAIKWKYLDKMIAFIVDCELKQL